MRVWAILAVAILSGCAAPPPAASSKADPSEEAWYGKAVEQLAAMDRQAKSLLEQGKADQAAAIITDGEPWVSRLLAVPRPTLGAMEAASDLDDLYGRMLLTNHNYGWARIMFQKNVARWKTWKPQTDETERRRKVAEAAIAECDRRMAE
ncbi:MAG TPA: hypothetical protein VLY24_27575 [Bryobacteraceae bacterium]|nr:hypothetical protein [Bryobacteraceae bacterium]